MGRAKVNSAICPQYSDPLWPFLNGCIQLSMCVLIQNGAIHLDVLCGFIQKERMNPQWQKKPFWRSVKAAESETTTSPFVRWNLARQLPAPDRLPTQAVVCGSRAQSSHRGTLALSEGRQSLQWSMFCAIIFHCPISHPINKCNLCLLCSLKQKEGVAITYQQHKL